MPVGAALSDLSAGTIYRFRISATSADGTTYGADEKFTTLQRYASGETSEPAVTATAAAGGLSIEASGGTGAAAIGAYGTNLEGPALAGHKGAYFLIDASEGSTFTEVEYTDCELAGARTLWWDDPATGWETINQPTAVYDESTHCITVTATAKSHPSIGQLADAPQAGGATANEEFGKCVPAVRGHFEDGGCTKEDFKEKKGVRTYRGSHEWLPAPSECYPQKSGHFADSGCSQGIVSGKAQDPRTGVQGQVRTEQRRLHRERRLGHHRGTWAGVDRMSEQQLHRHTADFQRGSRAAAFLDAPAKALDATPPVTRKGP